MELKFYIKIKWVGQKTLFPKLKFTQLQNALKKRFVILNRLLKKRLG